MAVHHACAVKETLSLLSPIVVNYREAEQKRLAPQCDYARDITAQNALAGNIGGNDASCLAFP